MPWRWPWYRQPKALPEPAPALAVKALDGWGAFPFAGYGTSGPKPNTGQVLATYSREPLPMGIVGRAAEAAATQTWTLYRCRSRRMARQAALHLARGELSKAQAARKSAGMTALEEHPVLDLLDHPNALHTGTAARSVLFVSYLLAGEGMLLVRRAKYGAGRKPVQLLPISPAWVSPLKTWNPFSSEKPPGYSIVAPFGSAEVPFEDLLVMRRLDPANPFGAGVGAGHALDDELDADGGAATYAARYLQLAPFPSLVASGFASQDQCDQARAAYYRTMSLGARQAFGPHFTTGKDIKLEGYQAPFNEYLTSLREFNREIFRQTVGYPPELVGDSKNSNRATATTAEAIGARNVTRPMLAAFADVLNYGLLPGYPDGDELWLEYEDPAPRDAEQETAVLAQARTAFTVDEVRGMGGFAPLPPGMGGDQLFAPPAGGLDLGSLGLGLPEKLTALGVRHKAEERPGDPPWMSSVLEALQPDAILDKTGAVWRSRLPPWGTTVLNEVGASDVAPSFTLQNPVVARLMEESARRITRVTETTRERTRDVLGALWRQGAGQKAMARELRRQFADYQGPRADVIALTEVASTTNAATATAWQMSGVVDGKRWMHNYSLEPRSTHVQMDGQVVGINAAFMHPLGYQTVAPGSFGVPSEDINCHCGMLPVVSEKAAVPEGDDREAWFESKAQSQAPWRAEATQALRDGFAAQLEAVLQALGKVVVDT